MTWVEGAEGSGFGSEHLPFGLISTGTGPRRVAVRIGAHAFDLAAATGAGLLPEVCGRPSLKPLMAAGPTVWTEVRQTIQDLVSDGRHRETVRPMLHSIDDVDLHLPFEVADYVDFYSSIEHATNLGKMFRPDSEPLLPNWRHLPVGYHGRAGTVVVSGTPITRPSGQRRGPDGPTFGPSGRLDIELEMGFAVGVPNVLGTPIPISEAGGHIFGFALVNDWSARDIQAWEYVPLGPFLGKSFATTISPWITPVAGLDPFRVDPPPQNPEPLEYLRDDQPWAFDLDLEVLLTTQRMRDAGASAEVLSKTNFRHMYWTPAQQLAHMTVNGATARTGDLCASGTISGSAPGTFGSLIELTQNGHEPIELANGEARTFLEDGDEVTLRGSGLRNGVNIRLGECVGRIVG